MRYSTFIMDPNKDSEALLALWKTSIQKYSPERFNWMYSENPYGPPITVLSKDNKSGRVVGCGSLVPRKMLIDGQDASMGIAADFIVEKEHRVFGPALSIQKALCEAAKERGFDLLFAFPSQPSHGVFSRVGYEILAEVRYYSKPLESKRFLDKRIENKILLKAISHPLNLIHRLADIGNLICLPGKGLVTKVLAATDHQFDNLWQNARENHSVIGEKISSYLNWRYASCRGYFHDFFCLYSSREKTLKGYIVYEVENGIARIVDLFAEDAKMEAYLLVKFSLKMRKEDIRGIVLTFLGSELFQASLRRFLFFERAGDRFCMVLFSKSDNEKFRKTVLEHKNWLLLDAEMDL
ncbi:MAG: GNAT family N-acetyltransferase [Smithellaceae bacterium]